MRSFSAAADAEAELSARSLSSSSESRMLAARPPAALLLPPSSAELLGF